MRAMGLLALLLPLLCVSAMGAEPGTKEQPHWAFQRPVLPPVPDVRVKGFEYWARSPIDRFVLAALARKGLTPSPPADRRTLLRRVTLDLTGLPPSPEEIAAFLADRSPDAYEKVVRRLLASPRYGERWAQHWLDVARFAETNGFELDQERPQSWRYRDYVVRSLNADKPYDRFILEQIAGDELGEMQEETRKRGNEETSGRSPVSPFPHFFISSEALVATGFLRAGPQHVVSGNLDPAVSRQEWLTEAVTGVGAAILGLTVQCARCHDHKFDPISQADYYRLQAVFAAADNQEFKQAEPGEEERYAAALQALRERLKPIQEQIAQIEKPYRDRLRKEKLEKLEPRYAAALALAADKRTPEQQRLAGEAQGMLKIEWDELVAALGPADKERRAGLRRQMHALELEAPAPPAVVPGVTDRILPPPTVRVLLRGDPHSPGAEVAPGFPAVLDLKAQGSGREAQGGSEPCALSPAPATGSRTTGRRLALARWLVSPQNPLTARVIVNRLWQHHFGRGIVATPNDFGRHGQLPTHPELLDWLAVTFMEGRSAFVLNAVKDQPLGKGTDSPQNWGAGGALPNTERRTPNAAPWSLKKLHELMVCSSAYRQATGLRIADWGLRNGRSPIRNPQSAIRNPPTVDPENRLLWRMNSRRLDAEALRDSVLSAAGTLNLEMGGPPVRVPLEPEVYATIFTEGEPDNLWPVTQDPRQHTRRSLYLLRKRNVRLPMLAVFDAPDMMTSCAARGQSVHALQALTLLNSDFMTTQSRALARRILTEEGDPGRRIERLFLLTLGRPPRAQELRATERFLREQTEAILRGQRGSVDAATAAAWGDVCLAALNLNEFVYAR